MAGIPSIMCGFAVILAIILTVIVVPRAHQKE
jgi:type II secretory pathway component PulF